MRRLLLPTLSGVAYFLSWIGFGIWPLAFACYLLVCIVQGFLFGVMSFALVWVGRRTRWSAAALLPIALVATEFAYPLLFQSYTGVALMPVLPLVQIADLGGPLILSALQAVVNGALFDALEALLTGRGAPVPAMMVSVVALVGSASYGYLRLVRIQGAEEAAPKIPVGLAQ